MDPTTPSRRPAGVALVVSSFVMMLLSLVFWTGVIPVSPESQAPLGGVLLFVGLLDAGVGLVFIRDSEALRGPW